MKTKGQRKAAQRRVMRKREKHSVAFRSQMAGDCFRRGYGYGIAD